MSMVSVMSDSCIGFFGDRERFPSDLIPKDHGWLKSYVHPDEIPRALISFARCNWMKTVSSFKRWAAAQREAAGGFEDSFIEEAISRQEDIITAEIVAWADRKIPKCLETRTPIDHPLMDEDNEFGSYFREPLAPYDPHRFLHFPKVQFQNRAHTEMTLLYLGLLLLVSYSAYPHAGHLPFTRWETAVKFCQCFAAHPNPEEMDPVNRILHLFYARLTFDDSFPQGMIH